MNRVFALFIGLAVVPVWANTPPVDTPVPELRIGFTTDSGHQIVDVHGMDLSRPLSSEDQINQISGVVDNGLFARNAANILVLGKADGVEVIKPHV